MKQYRNTFVLFIWMSFLVSAILGLSALGNGDLALPSPAFTGSAWDSWLIEHDSQTIAFAFLRAITLVIAVYLFVATLLSITAQTLRSRTLMRFTDRVTPRFVGAVTARALGISLATVLATTSQVGAISASNASADADAPPVLRHLVSGEAAPETMPTEGQLHAEQEGEIDVAALERASQRTVAPGENFWVIAENELELRWNRSPSDEELTQYWEALVELNRSRLSDAENPDLIFPGQVVDLPEATAPTSK